MLPDPVSNITRTKSTKREREGRKEVRTGKWVDGKEREIRDSTLGSPRQEGQHMFEVILGLTHPGPCLRKTNRERF